MLGIILIYFIGKQFYKLADEFEKNRWGISILGVMSYYVGQILFVIGVLLSDELLDTNFITDNNESRLSLIALPMGILICAGLYFLLQKNWNKNKKPETNLIDEIGKF